MIMKKLIAISVVFALVVGTAFAVDVSGAVIGTVNVLQGDSGEDSKVNSSAEMNRVRLEGSGGDEEGIFGGWVRVEGFDTAVKKGDLTDKGWEGDAIRFFSAHGYAWWKPIDQFKLLIGGNPDGFFGKEGFTGWMFYQTPADTGVVNPGNTWGGSYLAGDTVIFRHAFYGGEGGEGALLTISPMDIVDINIVLPFFTYGVGDSGWGQKEFKETGDVFKALTAQVDLKFDFGNIALTYTGDITDTNDDGKTDTNGKAYVYFNLGAVENLSLDVGVGLTLPGDVEGQPIAAGLGLKYNINDAFGIKFRTVASFGGDDKAFRLLADVLPFYAINDSVTAFLSGGLGMIAPDEGDSTIGFHLNPYVQVGSEWGPKFLAGFRLWSDGSKAGDDAIVNWAVPIAISVGF